MYICKICNTEFKSRMSIMNHIMRTHHYTGQQYYDEFYKQPNDGFCENCNKPTKFLNIDDGYAKCCSIKCAMPGRAKRNLEKYGYTDNFHNPNINKLSHSKEANEKRKATMKDLYGVESYMSTKDFKQKSKEYQNEHKEELVQKRKQTNIEKYGVDCNFKRPEVIEKNKINSHTKESMQKREKTTLQRYGVKCIFQLAGIKEKAQRNSHTVEAVSKIHLNRDYRQIAIKTAETKKKNGNKSSYELEFIQLCQAYNIEYIEEYSDERYPFPCDFYLPQKDCFVEIHGSWVHGGHIYNKKQDKKQFQEWQEKAKESKYTQVALTTWVEKDPKKLEVAKNNNLNYVILWSVDDIYLWFAMGCPISKNYSTYGWLPERQLSNKLQYTKLSDGIATVTKIAKVAQFEEFYKRELTLWNNSSINNPDRLQIDLYNNRLKYINKTPTQLTDLEIIRGLNISGKIRAYSTFNNSGLKYFLDKYKITSIYDPCAGWGERFLTCAARNIKYLGIDINENVVKNYLKLIKQYKLTDQSVIYGDSSKLVSPKDFNMATFTCPPYWNTEIYTNNGAENLSYDKFLEWWTKVIENANTEYFAYQINNKYAKDMNSCFKNYKLIDTYTLKRQASHLNKTTKHEQEVVYIFKKL